jgi:hypothetical protein
MFYSLFPVLFNFALERALRKTQASQEVMKLNGTDQLLVYVDYINLLGGRIYETYSESKCCFAVKNRVGFLINFY